MIKIISSEEHAKLTGNIDYWKTRALEEERSKNFYKTLYKEEKSCHGFYKGKNAESISDYMFLMKKYQKLVEKINNEHKCTRSCFAEHVLPAIQNDYNNKVLEFLLDRNERHYFLKYWDKKLKNEYDFVENLYMIADTIMVRF